MQVVHSRAAHIHGDVEPQPGRKLMAISDVLYESAEEIREYMRDRPEAYEGMKARLNRLLGSMDRLRAELDSPPVLPERE
jgi:hypothetical protein